VIDGDGQNVPVGVWKDGFGRKGWQATDAQGGLEWDKLLGHRARWEGTKGPQNSDQSPSLGVPALPAAEPDFSDGCAPH
jgi:hypothetical protein